MSKATADSLILALENKDFRNGGLFKEIREFLAPVATTSVCPTPATITKLASSYGPFIVRMLNTNMKHLTRQVLITPPATGFDGSDAMLDISDLGMKLLERIRGGLKCAPLEIEKRWYNLSLKFIDRKKYKEALECSDRVVASLREQLTGSISNCTDDFLPSKSTTQDFVIVAVGALLNKATCLVEIGDEKTMKLVYNFVVNICSKWVEHFAQQNQTKSSTTSTAAVTTSTASKYFDTLYRTLMRASMKILEKKLLTRETVDGYQYVLALRLKSLMYLLRTDDITPQKFCDNVYKIGVQQASSFNSPETDRQIISFYTELHDLACEKFSLRNQLIPSMEYHAWVDHFVSIYKKVHSDHAAVDEFINDQFLCHLASRQLGLSSASSITEDVFEACLRIHVSLVYIETLYSKNNLSILAEKVSDNLSRALSVFKSLYTLATTASSAPAQYYESCHRVTKALELIRKICSRHAIMPANKDSGYYNNAAITLQFVDHLQQLLHLYVQFVEAGCVWDKRLGNTAANAKFTSLRSLIVDVDNVLANLHFLVSTTKSASIRGVEKDPPSDMLVDECLRFLDKALETATQTKQTEDFDRTAASFYNFGTILYNNTFYSLALKPLLRSCQIFEQCANAQQDNKEREVMYKKISNRYCLVASCYSKCKMFKEALEAMFRAFLCVERDYSSDTSHITELVEQFAKIKLRIKYETGPTIDSSRFTLFSTLRSFTPPLDGFQIGTILEEELYAYQRLELRYGVVLCQDQQSVLNDLLSSVYTVNTPAVSVRRARMLIEKCKLDCSYNYSAEALDNAVAICDQALELLKAAKQSDYVFFMTLLDDLGVAYTTKGIIEAQRCILVTRKSQGASVDDASKISQPTEICEEVNREMQLRSSLMKSAVNCFILALRLWQKLLEELKALSPSSASFRTTVRSVVRSPHTTFHNIKTIAEIFDFYGVKTLHISALQACVDLVDVMIISGAKSETADESGDSYFLMRSILYNSLIAKSYTELGYTGLAEHHIEKGQALIKSTDNASSRSLTEADKYDKQCANLFFRMMQGFLEMERGELNRANTIFTESLDELNNGPRFAKNTQKKIELQSLCNFYLATLSLRRGQPAAALTYAQQGLSLKLVDFLHAKSTGEATQSSISLEAILQEMNEGGGTSSSMVGHSHFKSLSESLMQIGQLHELQGNVVMAEYFYRQGLRLSQYTCSHSLVIDFLSCLADMDKRRSQLADSLSFLSAVEQIAKKQTEAISNIVIDKDGEFSNLLEAGAELRQQYIERLIRAGDIHRKTQDVKTAYIKYSNADEEIEALSSNVDYHVEMYQTMVIRGGDKTPKINSILKAKTVSKTGHFQKTAQPSISKEFGLQKFETLELRAMANQGRLGLNMKAADEKKALKMLLDAIREFPNAEPLERANVLYYIGDYYLRKAKEAGELGHAWEYLETPAATTKAANKKTTSTKKQSSGLLAQARGYFDEAFKLCGSTGVPKLTRAIFQSLALCVGRKDPFASAYYSNMSLGVSLRHQMLAILEQRKKEFGKMGNKLQEYFNALAELFSFEPSTEEWRRNNLVQELTSESAPLMGINLPSDTTVVSICVSKDYSSLIITRLERGCKPINLVISLQKDRDELAELLSSLDLGDIDSKECKLVMEQGEEIGRRGDNPINGVPLGDYHHSDSPSVLHSALDEFDSIIRGGNAETLSDASQSAASKKSMTHAEKKAWWDRRYKLDKRMKNLTAYMDTVVLGPWKAALLGSVCENKEAILEACRDLKAKIDELHGFERDGGVDIDLLRLLFNAIPHLNESELQRGLCDLLGKHPSNIDMKLMQETTMLLQVEHRRFFDQRERAASSSFAESVPQSPTTPKTPSTPTITSNKVIHILSDDEDDNHENHACNNNNEEKSPKHVVPMVIDSDVEEEEPVTPPPAPKTRQLIQQQAQQPVAASAPKLRGRPPKKQQQQEQEEEAVANKVEVEETKPPQPVDEDMILLSPNITMRRRTRSRTKKIAEDALQAQTAAAATTTTRVKTRARSAVAATVESRSPAALQTEVPRSAVSVATTTAPSAYEDVSLSVTQTVRRTTRVATTNAKGTTMTTTTATTAIKQPTTNEATVTSETINNKRQHVVLILDKQIQKLPWEAMPVLQEESVSRMPSLLFVYYHLMRQKTFATSTAEVCDNVVPAETAAVVHPARTFYVVNPSGELVRTQTAFLEAFGEQNWEGIAGSVPTPQQFQHALENSDIFIYSGHGSGEEYFRGTHLQKLERCATTLLMGCSSGNLRENGEHFEPSGMALNYILAGCPCVVGNLWDVTDADIDRFSIRLLSHWIQIDNTAEDSNKKESSADAGEEQPRNSITPSSCEATATGLVTKQKKSGGSKTTAKKIDFNRELEELHRQRQQQQQQPQQQQKARSLTQCVPVARKACMLKYLIGAAPVCYGMPVYAIPASNSKTSE